jgi:hypothetical protein
MIVRLFRIQILMAMLTTMLVFGSAWMQLCPPAGIGLGATAAWLDFVVIKNLGVAMLSGRVAKRFAAPLTLAKSFVLLAVPACALLLPASIVDGVSFAIGVTTLPAAVVIDALLTLPDAKTGVA